MKLRILIASLLSLAAAGFIRAAPSDSNGLVVHEWGTFLAMNGSDGVSLDGMYHEEHALPPFVHARSRDQLRLPMSLLKNETPVIYFYTPNAMRVQVEVGFPTGLWTQWYPQASMVVPGLAQTESPPRTRNGRIAWDVTVRPPNMKHNEPPATSSDALWNHARGVDAAYVTTTAPPRPGTPEEWERFIFYRGLGEAPLPIDVRAVAGRISASTGEPDGLSHVFVLKVENGRGAYAYAPRLDPGRPLDLPIPDMRTARPLNSFVREISDDVAKRLVASRLYEAEARAMVNTWKSSYFATEGMRVLFVLPQSWAERFIPMRVTPPPAQLVRVMVGRVELLDPAREKRAEAAIRRLSSADGAVREQAFEALRAEGRYVEPIARRTLRTTTDEHVRVLSRRLLLTDFVTELRTSLTDAATGERVETDRVFVQAQLASLLRDVGLADEARQQGEAALIRLAAMKQPTMKEHSSRHMFRALARAHEGAGRDADALKWYGAFVEFGSQMATGMKHTACGGCHVTMGPRDMSFFRDWYAGRKFAEYAVKTGEAPRLIAMHETVLAANPGSVSSTMSLAYLYEGTGKGSRANEMWMKVGAPGDR